MASLGAPFVVRLPEGPSLTMVCVKKSPRPRDLMAAIECGAVTSSVDVAQLPLVHALILEAVAMALGAIECENRTFSCRNCEARVETDGTAGLAIEPLLASVGDVELDHVVLGEHRWPLPRPIPIARRGSASDVLLLPRTISDRDKLRALLGPAREQRPLALGPALVRAMGIGALGEVKSPSAIARALDALDDDAFAEVWDAIVDAWDTQHCSPRTLAEVICPHCGARDDLDVPERPLPLANAAERHAPGAFPSEEEFQRRARTITEQLLSEFPAEFRRGLEVVVDDDVPPCDDGGEPLLGSYTPQDTNDFHAAGPIGAPFVIALYRRTFAAMYREEPYDVDAEIRQTIEHELEHHENHLRGDDPLDEEERAAIVEERRRRLGVGSDVVAFASLLRHLRTDVAGFVARTWPVWLIALIALLITIASAR